MNTTRVSKKDEDGKKASLNLKASNKIHNQNANPCRWINSGWKLEDQEIEKGQQ